MMERNVSPRREIRLVPREVSANCMRAIASVWLPARHLQRPFTVVWLRDKGLIASL